MVDILIVLNNFVNDLVTASVFVTGAASFIIARRAGKDGELRALLLYVAARLNTAMPVLAFFAVAGAVARAANLTEFEWADAVSNGQVFALKAKFILLASVFSAGVFLWLAAGRKAGQARF